ncbi:MAG: hypothetical protein VX768_19675, partial [Planctomycetota bacterium]|nr:hypothetical protein [Planctomycetota bacterium]
MNYLEKDLLRLASLFPVHAFSNPESAEFLLLENAKQGKEHAALLSEYPAVRAEPLEFFYLCLGGLGALDLPLLEQMRETGDWRAITWSAFFIALEPKRDYLDFIGSVSCEDSRSGWMIDLAKAELGIREHDASRAPIAGCLAEIRALLHPISRPETPLRCSPSPVQELQMQKEKEEIQRVYRSAGSEAAATAIEGTLSGYFAMDYLV